MRIESDEAVAGLFLKVKRIALVGASAKPERPSHRVMQFLLDEGYEVLPINPGLAGQNLSDIRYTPLWQTSRPASTWPIFSATLSRCRESLKMSWLPEYPQCGRSWGLFTVRPSRPR